MNIKIQFAGRFLLLGAAGLALVACQTKPPVTSTLPHTSSLAASGSGNLSYRTTQAGQIYVVSITNNQLLFSGPVIAGQLIQLDTGNQQLMIDQRRVAEPDMNAKDQFEIFMDVK